MLTLDECEQALKWERRRKETTEMIALLKDGEDHQLSERVYEFFDRFGEAKCADRRHKVAGAIKSLLLAEYADYLASVERELSQLVVKP